jgi:hypothetical protein
VERWRTRAVLVAAALVAAAAGIAAVVGQTSDSSSGPARTPDAPRPKLTPYAQNPLSVKGTGFRPHERVRVTVEGVAAPATHTVRASAKGVFSLEFRRVNGCDSVTVTAVGSKGSRTSFNLSQIACIEQ